LTALDWVNPDGMLGQAFADPDATDLFLFPIRRHVRFEPADDVQVLLRTESGSPALAERTVGSGRLFVSAIGFGPAWSDLPFTGSFVPIIRELLGSAGSNDDGVHRLACGDPLPATLDSGGENSDVTNPAGVIPDTSVPGSFMWQGVPCEVNVSRHESVVEKTSTFEVQSRLGRMTGRARNHLSATVAANGPDQIPGRPLWSECAMAAAGLLFLELILLGLIDRRKTAVSTSIA